MRIREAIDRDGDKACWWEWGRLIKMTGEEWRRRRYSKREKGGAGKARNNGSKHK